MPLIDGAATIRRCPHFSVNAPNFPGAFPSLPPLRAPLHTSVLPRSPPAPTPPNSPMRCEGLLTLLPTHTPQPASAEKARPVNVPPTSTDSDALIGEDKFVNEEQQLEHIYKLSDSPKVQRQVEGVVWELDMDNKSKNLSDAGQEAMYQILEKHTTVFTDKEVKAGCTDRVKVEIRVKEDARPICAKIRLLSNMQKDNLKVQLDSLLKDGINTPAESPWGSPLIPVAKKDGKTRWAVDFWVLNAVTIADLFPVPAMGEVLMDLAGAKYFPSLTAAAFHNIPVKQESQVRTSSSRCNSG